MLREKILYALPITWTIYKIYFYYNSEYYHWNFGYSLGRLCAMLIVGINLWFDLEIFQLRNNWWIDFVQL